MTKLLGNTALVASLAVLGGCVNLNYDQSTVMGQAQESNFAAQVVDPTPAEGAPQQNAEMADAAYERYLKDEVKQPFDEGAGEAIGLSFSPNE